MRKPNRAVLLVCAGAATMAIGLTATTALADAHGAATAAGTATNSAGTWSVTGASGAGEFGIGPAVLNDPGTGGKIRCASPFVQFNGEGGMGLTHTLMTLKLQQFGDCKLPDGTVITVTPSTVPWQMTGTGFNSSTNLGVTTGHVRDMSFSFTSSTCSGEFDGTAAGANDGTVTYQYYNNPHWLIIRNWGGTLHAYDISGCAGIFTNGDAVSLLATFGAPDYLVITSP
jgi:hypothetical protein